MDIHNCPHCGGTHYGASLLTSLLGCPFLPQSDIGEGHVKKNINDPPVGRRPKAPRSQVARQAADRGEPFDPPIDYIASNCCEFPSPVTVNARRYANGTVITDELCESCQATIITTVTRPQVNSALTLSEVAGEIMPREVWDYLSERLGTPPWRLGQVKEIADECYKQGHHFYDQTTMVCRRCGHVKDEG